MYLISNINICCSLAEDICHLACAGLNKIDAGKGGLRNGKNSEKGVLRTGLVQKRILVTDVAQKGVLGSLFICCLYFYLVSTGGGLL